jgi:hypothetical protein
MAESSAVAMQKASQQETEERRIRVTLITTLSYEYHLNPHERVVKGILDPDTPDAFIEVPVEPHLKGVVKHAFVNTNQVAKMYLHDELQQEEPADGDKPARTTG